MKHIIILLLLWLSISMLEQNLIDSDGDQYVFCGMTLGDKTGASLPMDITVQALGFDFVEVPCPLQLDSGMFEMGIVVRWQNLKLGVEHPRLVYLKVNDVQMDELEPRYSLKSL